MELKKDSNRNMGIELLRILAMLMVVTLHCLGHGGVLASAATNSWNYRLAYLLETACYGAVDVYVLITGYVCVTARNKRSRLLELWLEVFLYSVLCTFIAVKIPGFTLTAKQQTDAFFPVLGNNYWFFSAYFCLMLFVPFLNTMLLNLNERRHAALVYSVLFVFTCMSVISPFIGGDIFRISSGYAALWFIALYCIGAYIRLHSENFKKIPGPVYFLIYILFVFIVWGSKLLIYAATGEKYGHTYDNIFLAYNSPFIVLSAVCLLLCFSSFKIKFGQKIISQIASVAFGVYLISDNRCIRAALITGRFAEFAAFRWYTMLFAVLFCAMGIFLICICIDFIRKWLFSLLRINKICDKTIHLIKRTAARLL